MSLMSKAFYEEFLSHIALHHTADIPVSGLASQVLSNKYARFPTFAAAQLNGSNVTCQLSQEAHVVDDLTAGLLIGIDNLAPNDIVLDFGRRLAIIGACQIAEVPLQIQSKPHHRELQPVYAASAVIIPPHSNANIPLRLRRSLAQLPLDRDHILEPIPARPLTSSKFSTTTSPSPLPPILRRKHSPFRATLVLAQSPNLTTFLPIASTQTLQT